MEIRLLTQREINLALFAGFKRTQAVTVCLRKNGGVWQTVDAPFTDDWDDAAYRRLTLELRQTLRQGGGVWGAFAGNRLLGFAAIAPQRLGQNADMLALSQIHVSAHARGQGVGRQLFAVAAAFAREAGARKLYISAHSALESQAFYDALGCAEALEYDPRHVALEPCDCQLEYRLLPCEAYPEPPLPSPLAAARGGKAQPQPR